MINGRYVWNALYRRGISKKSTPIIRVVYDGTDCHVLHRSKNFEEFEVLGGARQGCILSMLFVAFVDDVLHATLFGKGTVTTFFRYLD